jgi:putative Mn2+ efflux pump MntP
VEALGDFVSWAWERHHNPLSWWIRPLFLIPFAFFAYRRSWLGIAVTLVALATSMFWFPRPARVDPQVAEFLAAERRAVLGEWTLPKVVMLASIPAFFLGVGAAFWRRALWLAVLLIGLGALMKVVWSFAIGDDSARTLVPPAVFGCLVTALAVALGTGRLRRRSTS